MQEKMRNRRMFYETMIDFKMEDISGKFSISETLVNDTGFTQWP